MARMGGLCMTAPVLGESAVPLRLRWLLSVAIALAAVGQLAAHTGSHCVRLTAHAIDLRGHGSCRSSHHFRGHAGDSSLSLACSQR
jgi:hypothetical protein